MRGRRASTAAAGVACVVLAAGCDGGPSRSGDSAGPAARASATAAEPQICGATRAKPTQVRLRKATQEPLAPMPGVHGADVTPDSLRRNAATRGREGMELTARDFFAALEDPENFVHPRRTLSRYLDAGVNTEGTRLVEERITVASVISPVRWNYRRTVVYHSELGENGVGWFEQAGWLEGGAPGWDDIAMWQGRRAMLVRSRGSWKFACLSDSLPMDDSRGPGKEPSYVRDLDWLTYTPD